MGAYRHSTRTFTASVLNGWGRFFAETAFGRSFVCGGLVLVGGSRSPPRKVLEAPLCIESTAKCEMTRASGRSGPISHQVNGPTSPRGRGLFVPMARAAHFCGVAFSAPVLLSLMPKASSHPASHAGNGRPDRGLTGYMRSSKTVSVSRSGQGATEADVVTDGEDGGLCDAMVAFMTQGRGVRSGPASRPASWDQLVLAWRCGVSLGGGTLFQATDYGTLPILSSPFGRSDSIADGVRAYSLIQRWVDRSSSER